MDVGANFGLYSVLAAARLQQDGVLHAFEPNRRVFELLERNLSAMPGTTHASAHCMAVGEREGSVNFHCAADSAFSSAVATGRSPVEATVNVPQVSVDRFFAEQRLRRIDLIKVDVEGYEPEVIRGGRVTLSRDDAPIMLFEASPLNLKPRGLERGDVLRSIEVLGFEIRAAVRGLPRASELPASSPIENFVAFKPFRAERLRQAGLVP